MEQRKDYALSAAVAARMVIRERQCWVNAGLALAHTARLLPRGSVYVEGWVALPATIPGILPDPELLVIEHGWCERRSGAIVDPTYIGDRELMEQLVYFAGVRYTRPQVWKLLGLDRWAGCWELGDKEARTRLIGERDEDDEDDEDDEEGEAEYMRHYRFVLRCGAEAKAAYEQARYAAVEYIHPGWHAKVDQSLADHAHMAAV